ncbi:uncharacterized protein LOC126326120 [Schistocerca gregaria]|uniref:uncharacterized protein LOC126326120 n=1 Tax=Schistocerca gregaria TaxID=7010 RepID=UPI00211DF04A|nr:uncharacterized protein LOC126326120 [Schistocerca gregaria]XP_049851506.1 uncharacterized protein LOC126326120 [Schistocerca gregaria]XP_049851507.1 uncharacterized protein LOC126326120 [Schistocerca gregaria]
MSPSGRLLPMRTVLRCLLGRMRIELRAGTLGCERPNDTFKTFGMHEHNLPCIDVSPCGEYLLTVSIDRSVRIWHLRSGREVAKKSFVHWGWCCLWLRKEDVMTYEEPSLLAWALDLPEEVMRMTEEEEERRLERDDVIEGYEREMGKDLSHYRATREVLKELKEDRGLQEVREGGGDKRHDVGGAVDEHRVLDDSRVGEEEEQADEVILSDFFMQALSNRRNVNNNEGRMAEDGVGFPIYDMSFVLGDLNDDELHALLSFRQLSHQFEQLVDMQQQLPVVNTTFVEISQSRGSISFDKGAPARKSQAWPEDASSDGLSVHKNLPSSQFLILCSTVRTLLLLDHSLQTLASLSQPFSQRTSLRVSDGMKKISILLFIAELSPHRGWGPR